MRREPPTGVAQRLVTSFAVNLPELPVLTPGQTLGERQIALVASGDSRLAANQAGWADQDAMERKLAHVLRQRGFELLRAHPVDQKQKHGFLDSQRAGMNTFQGLDPSARVIVAEAVWQFSHHVLAGLQFHQGPILTVANWSGTAPGLVGLLNLNGSLTKFGVPYSTLWSANFDDPYFLNGLDTWLKTGRVTHDTRHVAPWQPSGAKGEAVGRQIADEILRRKAILGVFDEGCMGMMNAIIDDGLLNRSGIFKERLSQSALLAEMREVREAEAESALTWLQNEGTTFAWGTDEATELTRSQTIEQLKMYIAAVRMADRFSCDAIGIQYQLGLADMCASSDLAEGLLNNPHRPAVYDGLGRELFAGRAVPHFNEADEGAGVDALVTDRLWTALGLDPSNTLHDLRYGEEFNGEFVWVFLISGAAPASHFVGGYAGARSERQPPMYFRRGGGTLKGVSRPGSIVWSRVFIEEGELRADLGLGDVRDLPPEETERRWQMTTPQWPIMHAVLRGVSRDQMMGRHKSNHIHVVYAPSERLTEALTAKAACFEALGIRCFTCGDV